MMRVMMLRLMTVAILVMLAIHTLRKRGSQLLSQMRAA